MILLLALRNIVRNKKNSAIVMLLIGIITALFFIGNSVISSSSVGLRQSYVESLTGDIIIEKSGDVTMNLYGANAPIIENYFSIPVLSAYNAIKQALGDVSEIEAMTSQVSGNAYLDVAGVRFAALLCGVDADTYFQLLPGIILEEGRFLKSDEYGAMLTRERVDFIESRSGEKLEIGTPILFTSAGDVGFKIREAPLVGIYSYKNSGRFMDEIVILDPQTVRVMSAIQVATADVQVKEEALSLLGGTLSIEDIFSSDIFFDTSDALNGDAPSFVDELSSSLKAEQNEKINTQGGGDWNFIIIRLKQNANTAQAIAKINALVKPYDAAALGWRLAAGTSAILVLLLQSLFNAGVALVSVAGIMAIVNILLIAVFRRTREIGTLRAIGASDFYIRALILSENAVLGFFAGIAGFVLGVIFIHFINSMRLQINNELIAGLLGGQILHIEFTPSVALLSVALAEVLSALASIFPIETAVRIEPIIAVKEG